MKLFAVFLTLIIVAVTAGAARAGDARPATAQGAIIGKTKPASASEAAYIADTKNHVKKHWQPPAAQHRKVTVAFKIDARGSIRDLRLCASSGLPAADQAAIDAVRRAEPFPPLPQGALSGKEIQLSFASPSTVDAAID